MAVPCAAGGGCLSSLALFWPHWLDQAQRVYCGMSETEDLSVYMAPTRERQAPKCQQLGLADALWPLLSTKREVLAILTKRLLVSSRRPKKGPIALS